MTTQPKRAQTTTKTAIHVEAKHPGTISPLPFDAAEIAEVLATCFRILAGELPVDGAPPRRLRLRIKRDGLQSRHP